MKKKIHGLINNKLLITEAHKNPKGHITGASSLDTLFYFISNYAHFCFLHTYITEIQRNIITDLNITSTGLTLVSSQLITKRESTKHENSATITVTTNK